MAFQTITLQIPEAIYQHLSKLAQKTERPLEQETIYRIQSSLTEESASFDQLNAILSQLNLLTNHELWQAAQSEAAEEDTTLMQALLEKQQREGLTSSEIEQTQALSAHFNQIMLVRAKAAVLLAERGYDISDLPKAT